MNSVQTRRMYYWDVLIVADDLLPYRMISAKSFEHLERVLARVWKEEAPECWPCPRLHRTFQATSYCKGRGDIYLCSRQYSEQVLLHEIVHALGFSTHGPGFVKRYVDILVKQGADRGRLLTSAALFNVKIKGVKTC